MAKRGRPRSERPSNEALRKRRQRDRVNAEVEHIPGLDVEPVATAYWLADEGFPCSADDPKSISVALAKYVKREASYDI